MRMRGPGNRVRWIVAATGVLILGFIAGRAIAGKEDGASPGNVPTVITTRDSRAVVHPLDSAGIPPLETTTPPADSSSSDEEAVETSSSPEVIESSPPPESRSAPEVTVAPTK